MQSVPLLVHVCCVLRSLVDALKPSLVLCPKKAVFPHTCIPVIKLNDKIRHHKRLTAISRKELDCCDIILFSNYEVFLGFLI